MKKIILISTIVLSILFSGCSIANLSDSLNSKPEPETVIVKETVVVT